MVLAIPPAFLGLFAPIDWDAEVVHQWSKWSVADDDWVKRDRMSYHISGGREGGYRGYTYKRNIEPGEWRVDIETPLGQVLGRVDFEVVNLEGERGKELTIIKK